MYITYTTADIILYFTLTVNIFTFSIYKVRK